MLLQPQWMLFVILFWCSVLSFKKSLVYLAAEKGSVALSTVLPAKGVDANKLNSMTMLPLIHIAAENTKLLTLLLENNRKYSVPDGHDKDLLVFVVDRNKRDVRSAVGKGWSNRHSMQWECPFCIENVTPVHLAAWYGPFDVLEMLLDHMLANVDGKKRAEAAPKPIKKRLTDVTLRNLLRGNRRRHPLLPDVPEDADNRTEDPDRS
jgi:hypothetical protein